MADLLDVQHFDAGMARLRADTGPPALVVYPDAEGNVPKIPAAAYVRVDTFIERPADAPGNSVVGNSTTWTTYWYCRIVAPNMYALIATGMRVRAALLDFRPTIAARDCGKINQVASQPPNRDESTGTTVFDRLDIYSMISTG